MNDETLNEVGRLLIENAAAEALGMTVEAVRGLSLREFIDRAIKESTRVAYLNSWQIPVFKFTGSELYDDAINSADRVIAGIHGWWSE